jgi:SAM-dependent methyltransferase
MIRSIVENFRRKHKAYKKAKDRIRYEGTGVVCPICESTFKVFAPFGLGHRQNARCINCDSLERHRLLWLYFKEVTNLFEPKKKKLLHFAPEEMFYNVFSRDPHIDYVGCDLFPEIYNYGGPVKITKADITAIPFEAESFDVILCNHVLEHIPDDRKAMSELKRVLKPGGWCILQVPIDYKRKETYEDFSINTPAGRKKAFGKTDHVRWYGQDYKDRLTQAGFNVKEDPFINKFSPEDMHRYGLMTGEMIYYCTK